MTGQLPRLPSDWAKLYETRPEQSSVEQFAQALAASHNGEVVGAAAVELARRKAAKEEVPPDGPA